jgi:RimJ/RimL family protein N-acetyltransferase
MHTHSLSVRELQSKDVDLMLHYWFDSSPAFLRQMGVDLKRLPSKEQFGQTLLEQLHTSFEQKKSYCIIWELDHNPVGHSSVNPIHFGEEAYMHLHLWNTAERKKGLGTELVKMTLPWYFKNLGLIKLYCQPYSLNAAPHRTLEKAGFEFVKELTIVPGQLSFEQPVKRWELTREKFHTLQTQSPA